MAKEGDTHYHSDLDPVATRTGLFKATRPALIVNKIVTSSSVAAMACAVAILACNAVHAAGDPVQGEHLGYTCLGCHGIEGYRNAYPSFRVPKLGGQGAAYIEAALRAYRDGSRAHPTMHAQASSMSDADIENLAAWMAGAEEATDEVTTESVAGSDTLGACVACHGEEGSSVIPQPPALSGQHRDYLEYAIEQYREGARSGTVMSAFAASLSDADIAMLAAYYASLDGLETLEN